MVIRKINLPVTKEKKEFCDFMGYVLITQKNDHFLYEIPGNHVCRFVVNFERWKKGQFNKEKFLKDLELT